MNIFTDKEPIQLIHLYLEELQNFSTNKLLKMKVILKEKQNI